MRVFLARGSDVSLDRDDDVGGLGRDDAEADARGSGRLGHHAEVDRHVAVVQPAATVVAQVVIDAVDDVLTLRVRDRHRARLGGDREE